MVRNFLLILACLITVSGCGGGGSSANNSIDDGGGDDGGGDDGGDGGGGGTDPTDPPVSLLYTVSEEERAYYYTTFLPTANSELLRSSITDASTDFAAMPDTGSLDYAGYMQITMGNGNGYANVIGNMTLSVSMADNAITGGASGFMGSASDEYDTAQVVGYVGTVDITSGQAADDGTGKAGVLFDMDGTLNSGLNEFVVDTTLEGFIFGDGGTELWARGTKSGIDGSFDATIDGAPVVTGTATVSLNLE